MRLGEGEGRDHHLGDHHVAVEECVGLGVAGELLLDRDVVDGHPLLDQGRAERDGVAAREPGQVLDGPAVEGGRGRHPEHERVREDPAEEEPGRLRRRVAPGLHEPGRDDRAGRADRVVQEPDRLEGRDRAEPVVVDDLQDVRVLDPVDGLGGLVVVEQDHGLLDVLHQRGPREEPEVPPVLVDHAGSPVLRGRDQVLGVLERVLERDRRHVGLHDLPGRGREVEPPAHGERVEPGGEDRDVLSPRRVHHALADGCAVRDDHRCDPGRDQGQLRGFVVPDDRDVVGGQARERDVERVDRGVDPSLDLLVRADEHGRGEDPGEFLEPHRRDRERLLLLAGHVRPGEAVLGDEPGEAPVRVDDRDVPHVVLVHQRRDVYGRDVGPRGPGVEVRDVGDPGFDRLDVDRGLGPELGERPPRLGADLPAPGRDVDPGLVHVQELRIPDHAADRVRIGLLVPDHVDAVHARHTARINVCRPGSYAWGFGGRTTLALKKSL